MAFLELAIVLPFLMTLVLGVLEVGMMLHTDISVANSVRTAARVGSRSGTDTLADYNMLIGLGAAISNVNHATINYVTIYKVTGSSSAPPAACTTASAIAARGSSASSCNTYSGADLALAMTNTAAAQARWGCGAGAYDVTWCPTTRVNNQAAATGPDYFGVAISVTTPTFTHLFGSTHTYTDRFVMRIEPSGAGT